jgi:hypothetical protein
MTGACGIECLAYAGMFVRLTVKTASTSTRQHFFNWTSMLSCGSSNEDDNCQEDGIRGEQVSYCLTNMNFTSGYVLYSGCITGPYKSNSVFDAAFISACDNTGACHLVNPVGSSGTPTIRYSNFYRNLILNYASTNGQAAGAVIWGTQYGFIVENCAFIANDRDFGMSTQSRKFTITNTVFSGSWPSQNWVQTTDCVTNAAATTRALPVYEARICPPCPTTVFTASKKVQPNERHFESTDVATRLSRNLRRCKTCSNQRNKRVPMVW